MELEKTIKVTVCDFCEKHTNTTPTKHGITTCSSRECIGLRELSVREASADIGFEDTGRDIPFSEPHKLAYIFYNLKER